MGRFVVLQSNFSVGEIDPLVRARLDLQQYYNACERGRKTRNDLKLGICGEHGGDPKSVEFCHQVGLDYVSCSPFRVPIARLAAAHAAIKQDGNAKSNGTMRKAKKK